MVNQLGWGTIVRYGLYCAHARQTQIYLLTMVYIFIQENAFENVVR